MYAPNQVRPVRDPNTSRPYRQRGFTLLEMIVAIGVAAVLASTGALAIRYMNQDNTSSNLASGLNQVYNAAAAYVTTNYSALINNQPVSGFANPLQPTIQELVAHQFLPPTFSPTGYTGGTWRVLIQQVGTCPGASCNLIWDAYLDNAPIQDGKPSLVITAAAAAKSGVPAGYSTPQNPSTIIGLKAQWNTPNPVGAVPAILLAQGSYNSSQFAAYLPRSGALPMTGDLQMTDASGTAHNIVGVNNVSANTATLAAGNSLKIGNQVFYGDSTNAAVRTPGGFYVQNANGTGSADIAQVGNIDAQGRIGTNGINPNDLPPGWGGGVRTWDVYAGGTVGAGPGNGAPPNAYLNSGGYIGNQNFQVQPNGNVYTNGSVTANYIQSNGTVQAQTVQAANVITPGTAYGGANQGWGCYPNGAVAANANGTGQLMTCVNGAWQQAGGGISSVYYAYANSFVGDSGWIYNGSGHVEFITAQGGAQNATCGNNDWQLSGWTGSNGRILSVADNNQTGAKNGSIYFFVNPGDSWRVTSNPYNCYAGQFAVSALVLQ